MTLPLDIEHPKHQPEMAGFYDEHKASKGFAGELAKHVYDNWDDDFFRNGLTFALGELVESMIWQHRTEIQAAIHEAEQNHFKNVRKAIVKSAVISKIRSSMEEVQKTDNFRRQPAGVAGGHGGEFAPKGQGVYGQLHTGTARSTAPTRLRRDFTFLDRAEHALGVQRRSGGTPGAMSQDEAYRTAAMIANAYNSRLNPGLAQEARPKTMFVIRGPRGAMRMAPSTLENNNIKLPDLQEGEEYFGAAPMPYEKPITVGGKVTDIGTAFGLNEERAGAAGAVIQQAATSIKQQHKWGGFLGKMAQALVHATGATQSNNPGARVALHLANAAGAHGDEAAKVLGPHLRRLTYRYRGMEASPQAGQYSQTARDGRQSDRNGKKESVEAFEHKLAKELVEGVRVKTGPRGTVQRRGGMPSDAALDLALKTGSTTPSEGFILDRNGNVRSQSIGYSDDHYLPFNLRRLHHLDGGSYVRSRAYGGPTTEDMAAAIAAGAKRVTVVSKNGIYTVNFNPRMGQPRHRWGDARRTMVTRYGKILSAIQQSQVDDSSAEIAEGVTKPKLQLDGKGYATALNSLQTNFPYFIRSVSYTPANELPFYGQRGNVNGEDKGYVRPYYLKPSTAKSGYADEKVNTLRGLKNVSFDDLTNYRVHRARDVFLKQEQAASAPTAAPTAPGGIVPPGSRQAGTAGRTAEAGQQPVQIGVAGTVLGTMQEAGAGDLSDRNRVRTGIGEDGSIDPERMDRLVVHMGSAAEDVLNALRPVSDDDPRYGQRKKKIREAYKYSMWAQGESPDLDLVPDGDIYGGKTQADEKEQEFDARVKEGQDYFENLRKNMGERHSLIGMIRNIKIDHQRVNKDTPFDEPAFEAMQEMREQERASGTAAAAQEAAAVPDVAEQQGQGHDPWTEFKGSKEHQDYWQWGRANLLQKRYNALKAQGAAEQQLNEVKDRLAEALQIKSQVNPSMSAVQYMEQKTPSGHTLGRQLTRFIADHMPQEFGQSVEGAVENQLVEDEIEASRQAETAAQRAGPNPANRYTDDLDENPTDENINEWLRRNGLGDAET